MSDYDYKYRAPEALRQLRTIIDEVAFDERGNYRPDAILPTFLSLTYGGYEKQWHHAYANFLCSVEYDQKDVDSQLLALEMLKRLSEHIAARGDGWNLPTGRSVTTKWHRAQDGSYHLQVTENSIMDSSMAEDGEGGGFSVNLSVGPLQMSYAKSEKPRIGLLVSYHHRTMKKRLP